MRPLSAEKLPKIPFSGGIQKELDKLERIDRKIQNCRYC